LFRLELLSYPAPFKENVSSLDGKWTTSLQKIQLTVPHTSVDVFLSVDGVGYTSNEGDKDPDHDNYQLRDIFWCVPAEHKHTECVHRNSLFISDDEKNEQ
jgi:hypothetical protein